jgi:hypothetical protein
LRGEESSGSNRRDAGAQGARTGEDAPRI